MAIPRAQLETWTNPGATVAAEATHNSIRYALETAASSVVSTYDIDIFLQGSYRNATNIRSDSDVDVIVALNQTYTYDTTRLSAFQRLEVEGAIIPATYLWPEFRHDVITSLSLYYGPGIVVPGPKAVKVLAGNGRLNADVIPATAHKLYTSYGLTIATGPGVVSGISFRDTAGRHIVNFPKEHIANGGYKNAAGRANGHYKPIVRMFKNARRYLIERGRLQENVAPSYFVECLLYNVPDHLFVADRYDAMYGILEWLWAAADMSGFWCQNGIVLLFGDTPEQWTVPRANQMIGAMVAMWNEWPI